MENMSVHFYGECLTEICLYWNQPHLWILPIAEQYFVLHLGREGGIKWKDLQQERCVTKRETIGGTRFYYSKARYPAFWF